MRRLLRRIILWTAPIAFFGLLAWLCVPHFQMWLAKYYLDAAEKATNEVYRVSRPFTYRWPGAPYAALAQSRPVPQLNKLFSDLDRAEQLAGRTSRVLQLRGRAHLLANEFNAAVKEYHLALLSDPENSALQLEHAVALALRAGTGHSALDYEFALEAMLQASQNSSVPETQFNIAVMFEEFPIAHQGIERWQEAVRSEPSPDWRNECINRLTTLEQFVHAREQHIRELTASPDSYLEHANEAKGALELVLGVALEDWLPKQHQSAVARSALVKLAADLDKDHHDRWLKDLLSIPWSHETESALRSLSLSSKKNSQGEHIHAAASASSAERIFLQLDNTAGALRSRFERAYALDRQERPKECAGALAGLRSAAHRKGYAWIEGQSWLEEITCMAETRSAEVGRMRELAYQWISGTGYGGLRLRSLSFLTEAYASADKRLQIWRLGREGLAIFWHGFLPPLRGYTFYYTMASSARSAGNHRVALVLLREGTGILASSPHRQTYALVLSDLAAWEEEESLHEEAAKTFDRMEMIFAEIAKTETQKFWHEAEAIRAESEIASGKTAAALVRLQHLTRGLTAPFSTLTPTARRRMLIALGNAYLAQDDLDQASVYYSYAISESNENLAHIRNRNQRDNTIREVESAWRGLTEVDLRRKQDIEALRVWEGFRSLRSANLAVADGRPSKTYLTPTIRPAKDTSLLVYAFLPNGLSAWLADDRGVEHHWLDRIAVRREVQLFSALLADPASPLPAVRASAHRLYDSLIGPFASRLPNRGLLLIDADGAVAGVAWAALEDKDDRALVERFATSQVAGWAEIAQTPEQESIDNKPLIFGEPALGDELAGEYGRLLDAAREAAQLSRWMPKSLFFEGQAATLAELVKHAPNSTLFHFAGHGISYGEFGALLLAPSPGETAAAKFMTADEIADMGLSRLQLVTLAACSSGTGEESGLINLDSLVRAFLEAGSHRVVAARWDVSSGHTSDLMTAFYQLILQGKKPSDALRQAALKVRSGSPHPFNWAAFQLFGEP